MLPLDLRRRHAVDIAKAAIRGVDPHAVVLSTVSFDDDGLRIGTQLIPSGDIGRIVVVGAGKAAGQMVRGLEDALGDRIDSGIVVTKDDHTVPTRHVELHTASHPVPDSRGVAATAEMLDLVRGLNANDIVFVLLSGGGSALLVAPVEGVSLADKQETTSALLACGATIDEINSVRKHLSRVKGGLLARECTPARVITLALSDVIGDPADVIASGPTVSDTTSYSDALSVLERYSLLDRVPRSVIEHFDAGLAGRTPDTPKIGDPSFDQTHYELVGTNHGALEAARAEAVREGYSARILTSSMRGEAREVAKTLVALAEGVDASARPIALILGGETTVTLNESPGLRESLGLSEPNGLGGRNQELALAAARDISGRDDIVILSVGTDGTDGPTDAAGGVVDGDSVARAVIAGLDIETALRRHDSYPVLKEIGDLVVTGPTGTNVMDVMVALVG
jgi:glycerate 2-kinase